MSRYTLSAFQREKLSYYFKFFKPNENNELDENSLDHFMDRVLEFTGWSPDSADASGLRQVHEAFFEIMFDKTADSTHKCRISLENWLDVWNNLLPGCMGMNNFPVWLRILPKQLFRAMDRDKDGHISAEELFNFYHYMVKMPYAEARANSKNAFNQMTDYGRYPLDADGYEQIFANFLLGQTPHGPGRHIFGCFEHRVSDQPFQLIKPAKEEEDTPYEVKVYLEKRPKRVSLTGL